MARRRSGLTNLVEGFNQGYDSIGKVLQDSELRKIADAQVQETPATLTEKNAPGDNYVYDSDTGQYVQSLKSIQDQSDGTPGLEPIRPQFDAGKPSFTLLGKTSDTPFTSGQVMAAKNNAMADVVAKNDPIKAQQLRQAGIDTLRQERIDRREQQTEDFNNQFGKKVADVIQGGGLTKIDTAARPAGASPDSSSPTGDVAAAPGLGNVRSTVGQAITATGGLDGMAQKWRALVADAATNNRLQDAMPTLNYVRDNLKSEYLRDSMPGDNTGAKDYANYMRESAKFDAAFGQPMVPDQALKNKEMIRSMQKEGAIDALQALHNGDIAKANQYGASGDVNWTVLEAKPGTYTPPGGIPIPTTYATVRDTNTGQEKQINTAQMLMGLQTISDQLKLNVNMFEAAAKGKTADATADYWAGAKTDLAKAQAEKAKLEAQGGGLGRQKWDAKVVQQHIKDNADMYTTTGFDGTPKVNVDLKSGYSRMVGAYGPDAADNRVAMIRDKAEQLAKDPKTGELDQDKFQQAYLAGIKAEGSRLLGSSAPRPANPAPVSAPAPAAVQAAAPPIAPAPAQAAPPQPGLTKIQPGPSYAAWMQAKADLEEVKNNASRMNPDAAEAYLASRVPDIEARIRANQNYYQAVR